MYCTAVCIISSCLFDIMHTFCVYILINNQNMNESTLSFLSCSACVRACVRGFDT